MQKDMHRKYRSHGKKRRANKTEAWKYGEFQERRA
jgi:hypothetical protein